MGPNFGQTKLGYTRFKSKTPPIVTFGLRSSAIFGNLRYRRFHQPSVFGTEDKNSLRSTPNRNRLASVIFAKMDLTISPLMRLFVIMILVIRWLLVRKSIDMFQYIETYQYVV